MTSVVHSLVAGALVTYLPNQPAALGISFLSHPLLDMVPHWDAGWEKEKKSPLRLRTESVADMILGYALAFIVFGHKVDLRLLFLAVTLSISWDIVAASDWSLKIHFPILNQINSFQSIFHSERTHRRSRTVFEGILLQVLTIVGLIILLKLVFST